MSLIVKLKDLEVRDARDFDLTPADLEITDRQFLNAIHAHLDIFKGGNFLRVQGTVHAVLVLNCARCTEDFEKPIDEQFGLDYIMGRDPYQRMERVALKGEDMNRVYFEGDSIDLSIGIRDTLILAAPIAPVCKEDCKGICPQCGGNLNQAKCGCQ